MYLVYIFFLNIKLDQNIQQAMYIMENHENKARNYEIFEFIFSYSLLKNEFTSRCVNFIEVLMRLHS